MLNSRTVNCLIIVGCLCLTTKTLGQQYVTIDASGAPHKLKGTQAPNFTSMSLDGKTIALEQYRGKIVLLSFWSLSCAACFKELPELNELTRKYSPEEFDIISLMDNVEDELYAKFDSTQNGYRIKNPIFGNDRIDFQIIPNCKSIMKLYSDMNGFPQIFILNKEGKITFYFSGYAEKHGIPGEITSNNLITKEIDRLLRPDR